MASQKDEVSELGESEDIPSDFFDDFNKDEFMEGLSVVDEVWEDVNGSSSQSQVHDSQFRIQEKVLDRVKDLRELIGDNGDDNSIKRKSKKDRRFDISKYRWRKPSSEKTNLDNFIKPGSRRDLSKTNQAIKKDKEVKVQQFLAKSLESQDELRPPGTELDDYYENENKKNIPRSDSNPQEKKKHTKECSPSPQRSRRSPRQRHSPRPRRSPRTRISPRNRSSPRVRSSPQGWNSPRGRNSPHGSPRRTIPWSGQGNKFQRRNHSPLRRSPVRNGPRRYSPARRSPRRPLHRSRSPRRRAPPRRSRSRSRSRSQHSRSDNFLYPNNPVDLPGFSLGNSSYLQEPVPQYAPLAHPEFPGSVPGFYPQAPAYDSGFTDPYAYGVPQSVMPGAVMMPNVNPASAAPPMVPAPNVAADKSTPFDALAQLVAEGKISQEDYLKLTPHKGAIAMDPKTKSMVVSRCQQALAALKEKLLLPNRLIIDNQKIGAEDKCIAPEYCSPLKRLAVTELNFTKGSVTSAQQTKQLVESIVSTLGLDKVISKYKKRLPKNMQDAVIQTTKSACEVCEIRESTKYHDASTSTEPEYFTSTVHTQVVEQDLVSSKSIFNPSGSVGEGAAISISHMTPAQLVSQLAARAKTLKQPQEPPPANQFARRPPPNFDYDNRGGQYHHSYNNYRY